MDRVADTIFITYFSNYSAHAVEYKGVLYPTVEHAYHCQRYTESSILEEIRSARSPYKAWQISQIYKAQQQPDFSEHKSTIMEEICRKKLFQHEEIQRELLASGGIPIVKHWTTGSLPDGFWDDGTDGSGKNIMGQIWMRLREELKQGTTSA